MENSIAITFYVGLMLVIWGIYAALRSRRSRRNIAVLDDAKASEMSEPASLHPLINLADCIGCGSCVDACPEKKVLGLIHGKAHLINPASCIGHGACRVACPTHSIDLVFGTEKRGVDIPFVDSNFETNVAGIFIAGELGGMGLIRNAVTQGVQATEAIGKLNGIGKANDFDLIIIGAGPAGIAAALSAKQQGLRYTVLEQDSLGGTVAHYPRGKLVMTAPVELPIVGKMPFTEIRKEQLLEFWQQVTQEQQLSIRFNERVEAIESANTGFIVKTSQQKYSCCSVLLAIGRRGTPRKLGVPGEEQSKVVYRLIDPEQYQHKHVLVVGGGDSALEAACSIAEQPGTTVTLSYRGDGFSRSKQKNRERVQQNEADGRLNVMLNSNVVELQGDSVELEQQGKHAIMSNDAVIVCAGGILPTPFLKTVGIVVETKFGTA